VLNDGKAQGGDSGLYYDGSYQVSGDQFSATLSTGRHDRNTGMVSVFGVDEVTINLQGSWSGDQATVRGSSPQAPGVSFDATLKRLAD
jgi:hypothetical protein